MSQKSSLQSTMNGKKQKALELKNQPKMTGFIVSSPKLPKTEEPLPNFKSKYRHLFEHVSPKKHSKKQVIQVDSDPSESETVVAESPVFPKKAVTAAKKPLVPYKCLKSAGDSDCLYQSSIKLKEKSVRNPLKETKTVSSFNITKKKEGAVTKFSSEYNDESEAPALAKKKKRFFMNPTDSIESQIDILCTSVSKRKSAKTDEPQAKRHRNENKSEITVDNTSSSASTASTFQEDPKAHKENIKKEGYKQKLNLGNLPIKKRIIRKSALIQANSQSEGFQISKKMLADYEQVNQGARLAYLDTRKDLETLLNMQMHRRVCLDLDQALKCERSALASRYHINFEFQMQRDDYEGALSSLRSVSRLHYPNKKDLHAIVYTIIEKTNDEGVLQRAQDLLYKVLSLHPPIGQTMRQYYSFLLTSRQNDTDFLAPWENLMNLLEQILTDDETARNSSTVERRKATLGFIVQLLYEDFYCWINYASDHSESLRNREGIPLIANILWPRSTIPVLNSNCRELIKLHIKGLQSQPDHVFYTQPLVHMMAAITQLVEPNLPLKFRKPSEHMGNLAREIISLAGDDIASQSYLFTSFGLRELELLLPLAVLNNLKPGTGFSNPNIVSLRSLIEIYLVESDTEPEKVLEKFKSQTVEYRRVFISALSAYFNLFGSFKAWHSIAQQSKSPSMINQNSNVSFPIDVFSNSFTLDDFIDDLRQANPLLKKVSLSNTLPKKSLYSFLCLNVE